jgi:hypothetical protein
MGILEAIVFVLGAGAAGLLVALTRLQARTTRPARHWLTM